jgi:hypothetical protein
MVSVVLLDEDLLFLHVPKTAGGSISRALRKEPSAVVYPVINMSQAEPCAAQLRRQLPKSISNYRVVSVVRNPWDWTVSAYLQVTVNAPAYDNPPAFKDFLLGDWRNATRLQYPEKFTNPIAYVTYLSQITQAQHVSLDGGALMIDHVCRFENLEPDLQSAFARSLDIPHVHRSDRLHYSRYYDVDTKALIAQRNADLIAQFGYSFEEE